MEFYLKRVSRTMCQFADEASLEAVSKWKIDDTRKCEGRQARNLQMHRLFFALIQIVFENQEKYQTAEEVRARVLVGAGHCDVLPIDDEHAIHIPKSISFANMGQDEFHALFDRAVDYICQHVIPGLGSEELKQQVYEMVQEN